MAIQTFTAGQTLTASQMNTLQGNDYNYTRNVQTGTTYTLQLSDRGLLVEFQNAGTTTVTVPAYASVAFDVGDTIEMLNASTGTVNISGAAGVTISAPSSVSAINSQWQRVFLVNRGTNTWALLGSTSGYIPDGSITASKIADGTIIAADIADGSITSAKILDGTIVNADINTSAGIALSKLATSTAGYAVIHNASGVPTATEVTGDITISSSGVTAIGSGKIVNDDVNASAAIVYSKLNLANSISATDLASGAPRAGFRSSQNQQTGTTYTLALSDVGGLVELSNTSSITVTIPLESSVAFSVGDRIDLLQTNTGQVTVAGAVGVTLNAYDNQYKLNGRWAAGTLIKRAADTWVLIGNITS